MPRHKISPSKLDRDMPEEARAPGLPAKRKSALTALLSDISKMSEGERQALAGSTLLKLDQAMRAAAAEHTKTRTSKAGTQRTAALRYIEDVGGGAPGPSRLDASEARPGHAGCGGGTHKDKNVQGGVANDSC